MNKISVKKKTENFIVLDKTALNDNRLSWKAKGLHSYLMALPDDWALFISDLENRSTDGRDSTRGAINELLNLGYIERITKKENGKFMGYDYSIYEKPFEDKPHTEKPKTEKPQRLNRNGKTDVGLTENGKSHTNKVLNKEILNKENIDINDYRVEKSPTDESDEQKAYREMTEHLVENPQLVEKPENKTQVAGGGGAKKEKKVKAVKVDNKKDLLDCYPTEESFAIAWGLRFGTKYPNIDASKAYTKLLQYSLNKGVKYADWVLTAKVWYEKEETASKRSTWEITEKSQTVQSKMQAAEDRLYRKYPGPL